MSIKTRTSFRGLLFFAALTSFACGPAVSEQAGGTTTTGATSGAPGTSSTDAPGSTSTTAEPPGSSTTTRVDTSDSSASTTGCIDEGPTVAPDPDDPESRCLSSDLEFDCGCGHKCNVYVPNEEFSGRIWENSGCFPLDPEPVGLGDPCVHEDFAWSGRDNCPDGAMCWDVDGDGTGVCHNFCSYDEDFDCGEPDAQPWIGCQECGCVCQVSCSPLLGDCAVGEICTLSYALGICVPDYSEKNGAPGDPCNHDSECASGNACLDASAVPGCGVEGSFGCCSPYCDASDPTCPEGTECLELWDPGEAQAPILEGLGYCVDPALID